MHFRKQTLLPLVAVTSIVAGLVVCLGWVFEIQFLQSISNRFASMKFNTAVCFILSGSAFYFLVRHKTGFLFRFLTGLVFAYAGCSLLQKIAGISLGIDLQSSVESICFLLLMLAFLSTASARESRKEWSIYLYPLVSLVSFITLVDYIYQAPGLHNFTFATTMALHTAIGLFVLSIAGSLVHHEKGLPGLFIGNQIGNIMARNLFPKVVVIAFIFGYLRLFTYHFKLISLEFGFALYSIAFVTVGLFLLWHNARDLNKLDAKRIAAESKKNDEKFRALVENSHEAICLVSQEGEIMYSSPAAERMMGRPCGEMKGEKVTSYLHAGDVDSTLEFYLQILEEPGIPKCKSHRLLHKDGYYIWTEGTVTNMLNNPNIGAIVANFHDVSERKKAEQDFLESELRYSALFEQASDSVMITDLDGKFLDVNISLCKLFGYTKEELLGQNVRKLIDPAQLAEKPMRFDRLAKGEHVFNERHMVDKSGKIIVVEANVKMLFDGRVVAIARDITERKIAEKELQRSETRFRDIAERAPVAICCYLVTGEMIFLNSRFTEITGYQMDDIPSRAVWYDLAFPDREYRDRVYQQVRMQLEKSRKSGVHTTPAMEVDIVCKDGSVKTLEVSRSMYDDRIYVIASDITERKKAEEEILRSHRELRELSSYLESIREEERTCIAREIHDELGQQLTVLKMDASWIGKKVPRDEAAIQEKIGDMIALIDDTVKTMRRIASELRPGILDDLGLLPALEWQSSEFEKRCGIECKFSSKISDLKIDKKVATGLFRIYQEALTNVARHSGATMVQTAFDYGDGNNLVLVINDNGKGFDSEILKTKTTLGMAGMKERVTLMSGEIVIGSIRSKGTTILIKVPYSQN